MRYALPAPATPDAAADARPSERAADIHQNPWVGLVYLFFVFFPLVFRESVPVDAIWASVAAVAAFVPLHFMALRVDATTRVWLALAMAGIAYALVPFNSGAHTFVLYAVATLAWSLGPLRSGAVALALFALLTLQMLWLYPKLIYSLGTASLSLVLGAVIFSSIHFERARIRRDAQLRLSQDEVRRLARLAERERIGRDLHDLLGHTLSLVALKTELAGRLLDHDPDHARRHIAEVEQVARQALAEMREAVSGMRSPELQAELAAARLALGSAGVDVSTRIDDMGLPSAQEQVLAMALREGVTNVIRHAKAERVEITLARNVDTAVLEILDDGCGATGREGNGLTGMRERLAELGGWLELGAGIGGGTRLGLHVPLPPATPPAEGAGA